MEKLLKIYLLKQAQKLAIKWQKTCYDSNSDATPETQNLVVLEVEAFERDFNVDLDGMMGRYEEENNDFNYAFDESYLEPFNWNKKSTLLAYLFEVSKYIESQMSDNAKDFVDQYRYEDIKYLCDAFQEFADNNTSLYYYELREYYYQNEEYCDNALLEIMDEESIVEFIKRNGIDSLLCKAGELGQNDSIIHDLWVNELDIKKMFAIDRISCEIQDGKLDINGLDIEELIEKYESEIQ